MADVGDSPTVKVGIKRRRQPELVRGRIITSALDAFATNGFEGASMRAIADEAHTSISLLIYHFKNKEELWRVTMEDVLSRTFGEQTLPAPVKNGHNASDELRRTIDHRVRLFAEFPALHRLMTLEGHQPSDRLIWLCDNYIRQDHKRVCALIAAAQKEGQVVDGDPTQMRMAITAMAAVPFSVSAEYQYLSGRNPFAKSEIEATIKLIHRLVFKSGHID